jgi:hypothetical protein
MAAFQEAAIFILKITRRYNSPYPLLFATKNYIIR